MSEPASRDSSEEWGAALLANDVDSWVEHLDRTPVCDFFPALVEQAALNCAGVPVSGGKVAK